MPEAPAVAAPAAPAVGNPPGFSAPESPSIFADIDRAGAPDLQDEKPKPAKIVAKDPPKDTPKDSVVPPKEVSKDAVKDAPKDTKPSVDEDSPDKMAPKQLRDAYTKLKQKLKDYESKPPSNPLDHPDFKSLNAKHEALTKELEAKAKAAEDLENKIRFLDYEQSGEFLEKYHKPYVETWKSAMDQVSKLSIPKEDGSFRKATLDDFSAIVSEPDTERALQLAEDLFQNATKANYAIGWREKIISASQAQEQAKAEFRDKGAAISKQAAEEQSKQAKMESEMWKTNVKAWAEKNPNFVTPDDGDAKGRELFDLGSKAADIAFSDTSHLSSEQRSKLYADTRNRAAAFGLVAHKLEKANSTIEDLKAKLAEYEESGPGSGEAKRDSAPGEETMEQKIDRAAK